MSLHTWHRQSPRKPSSCTTFTLNSHSGRAATCKKVLHLCTQDRFGHVWLFATLWSAECGLPGFCVRKGFLQARIMGHIGQYRLPYPSRVLYFLLPWLPTPLSTWCCQNPCDPSSCPTSTPGPHGGKAKSSRAASGANPSDDPHAEVETKPQLKPRGSVAKEEDPKPSHQVYKLQIKFTQSTQQILSKEYIKGHWELPQKKTH